LRPDEFLFADVGAALELANRNGLKLCFSLMDYLWLQDRTGKPAEHANETGLAVCRRTRKDSLHRVLIPMFREFREHPGLFAWEIANEPEWAIREFHRQPAVDKCTMRISRVRGGRSAQAVREFSGVPVTLRLGESFVGSRLERTGLGFLPAHTTFPVQDPVDPNPASAQLGACRTLAQTIGLGELSCQG